MTTIEEIKQSINQEITTNSKNEISGAILNGVLSSLADYLSEEATKMVENANESYIGAITPLTGSPLNADNKPIWGDVSNDTGSTQTYTNFKDSAGNALQLVAGKSGKFSYDGIGWSFIRGDKTPLDATLKIEQPNVAALDASSGKFLNDRVHSLSAPLINIIDATNFGQGGWNPDGTRMVSASSSYSIRLGTLAKLKVVNNFLQFFVPEGFQLCMQCYNDFVSGWSYDSGWLENGARTIDISQYSFYDLMIRKADNTALSMSDITVDFKWNELSAFYQSFRNLDTTLNNRILSLTSPLEYIIDSSGFGQGGWNPDGTRMPTSSSSYSIRIGSLEKMPINLNFFLFSVPTGYQASLQAYMDLNSGWSYDSGWLENGVRTADISSFSYYNIMIRKVDNSNILMSELNNAFKYSGVSEFNETFANLDNNTNNGLNVRRININSFIMEQGTIVSGNKAASSNRIRTFSLIQQSWDSIYINIPVGYKANLILYDETGLQTSLSGWNDTSFDSNGGQDFSILIAKSDDSDLTPSDLDALKDADGNPLIYFELKTAIKNAFKVSTTQSNILQLSDFQPGSWITGFKASSGARARSKGRIFVKAKYLRLVCPEDYYLNIQWSDENSVFLSDTGWQKNGTIIENIDKPFTIAVRLSSNGNFSPSAIDGSFFLELLDSPIPTDTYTGNKIELNRQSFSMQMYLAAIQWGAMNSGSVQGLAIYGDKMFIFYDTGKVNLFQYSTKQFLTSFLLPQTINNHCNSVCWGKEFPAGNNTYPALYDSEFYGDNRCLVYSMSDTLATLIQSISIGTMTNPLFMTTWHVDVDNSFLWALSCKTNILSSGTDNNYWVTKFNLPSLASGNIVLTDADIIEQFDITNEAASQGFEIYNGIMILLLGLSEQAKIKFIDLNAGNTEINNISLAQHGMEPEDCQVYKGELHVVFNYQNGTVCKLNF